MQSKRDRCSRCRWHSSSGSARRYSSWLLTGAVRWRRCALRNRDRHRSSRSPAAARQCSASPRRIAGDKNGRRRRHYDAVQRRSPLLTVAAAGMAATAVVVVAAAWAVAVAAVAWQVRRQKERRRQARGQGALHRASQVNIAAGRLGRAGATDGHSCLITSSTVRQEARQQHGNSHRSRRQQQQKQQPQPHPATAGRQQPPATTTSGKASSNQP